MPSKCCLITLRQFSAAEAGRQCVRGMRALCQKYEGSGDTDRERAPEKLVFAGWYYDRDPAIMLLTVDRVQALQVLWSELHDNKLGGLAHEEVWDDDLVGTLTTVALVLPARLADWRRRKGEEYRWAYSGNKQGDTHEESMAKLYNLSVEEYVLVRSLSQMQPVR